MSNITNVTTTVKLQPFRVPNFVLIVPHHAQRQDGFKPEAKFSLSELEPDTLSDLCDEFRREVFAKAGKDDPRSTA